MRRVLVALLAGVFLTGCWSRVEVNDLAIVSMMAMDRLEDGRFGIWLHVVKPRQAGGVVSGGGGGGGDRPDSSAFVTHYAEGRTLLDASRQMQLGLSRRLFWAHARVILIGENLARSSVRDAIDFVTRHRELRLNNFILTVKGPVEPVMAVALDLERLPVEALRELSRSGIGARVNVGEFATALSTPAVAPFTGLVEAVPPPEGAPRGQKGSLRLTGSAIYRDDRLAAFLDEHETRGLLWLRNEMRRGIVTVEVEQVQGYISLEWVTGRVERFARMQGDQPVIEIVATTEGDLGEQSAYLDLSDPGVVDLISRELGETVRGRIQLALDRLREENVDAAGLGEVIHRQLPAVWRRLEKGWESEGFRRAKVVVKVEAYVRRTGLSSKPRGLPEDELIKGVR